MAKKADLLQQAQDLDLDVTAKNTIDQIQQAIDSASHPEQAEGTQTEEEQFTKAGKRSKKAVQEAEEQAAKEERKVSAEDEEAPKKNPAPKTRPRAERRGKKYKAAYAKVDRAQVYELAEALKLATDTATTKFDSSVELHIRLNVDPRQADQNIRATLVLPAGTGKEVRVAVFCDDSSVKDAKAAGADIAGSEDFLQTLDKGEIDFDVLIATPSVMAKLGKYARVLGPKGLMPSPKSGTVTTDIQKAVQEAKAGKIEYRVDEYSIVHLGIGKVSFGADKLLQNAEAVVGSLRQNKPGSIKGNYIVTSYVTTSMGPSIKTSL